MHRLDFHKRRDLVSVDPDRFRSALRQFASGVTIVTAGSDETMYGITVSAFTSISLDPPMVMVAIANTSALAETIVAAEHYSVNILGGDQEELSARFAESLSGTEKYRDVPITIGLSGAPGIAGALAVLDCVLDQTLLVGTHTLMFGRVIHATADPDPADPLLYYHRAYRRLAR